MKVTDEMTATQIITLIQKLLDDVDVIYSDCENICASMELLRETDHSKTLEAAETWAHTAFNTTSDVYRALRTVNDFLSL
jgi:hypothetical protein